MALRFINNTRQTKIEGEFIYDTINYEYTLYLSPFNSKTIKNEIINYFGNRQVNISKIDPNTGEKTYDKSLCLGLDKTFYKDKIKNAISAFIKVSQKEIDNVASATIQIYNHCNENEDIEDLEYAQVWVNDVCRVSNISGNIGNPVKGLFYFIEQLTIQNLGKNNIKLFVEKTPIENLEILYEKYVSLGFQRTEEDEECEQVMINKNRIIREEEMKENEEIIKENEEISIKNKTNNKKRKIQFLEPIELTPEWDNIIMTKHGLVSEPFVIDLSLNPELEQSTNRSNPIIRSISEPLKSSKKSYTLKRTTSIGGYKQKVYKSYKWKYNNKNKSKKYRN